MSDEVKLNALLNMYGKTWEDIKFYQKRGDDAPYLGLTLLASMLGLQFFTNMISSNLNLLISLSSIVVPFVLLLSLQRGGHDHNFVAVLRGYAAFLEDEINILIKKNVFLFNSEYVDKYIRSMNINKKSKFKTTWLITCVGNMFPIIICAIIFVINNINNLSYIVIAAMYYVVIIILCCICLKDFIKKESKRIEARYFPNKIGGKRLDKTVSNVVYWRKIGGEVMGSEYDSRKNDKSVLFQALKAQKENNIENFILWQKSQMNADDVKLVLQEFEKLN